MRASKKSFVEVINLSTKPAPRKFLAELDAWLRPRLATRLARRDFMRKNLLAVYVDARRGRALNKTFRGKNYATDVLSFAPLEADALGELVFCVEVLTRQARVHQLSLREELAYLYIHGFLHLLGYDHEKSKRAAAEMFAIQDALFDSFLAGR